MNNQVELLPCPFCGGEAKLYDFPDEHPYIYRIGCIVCATAYGCKYSYSEKQTAINMWNERIPIIDIPGVKELVETAFQKGFSKAKGYNFHHSCIDAIKENLANNYMKGLGG